MTRRIGVALADTHCGHLLGLLNPDTRLPGRKGKAYKPTLTETQRYLWRCYKQDVAGALSFAAGDEVILLTLGDLCNGDKYPTELVTTNRGDQITMAVDALVPWLEYPNLYKVRVAYGTAAHGFGEGAAEDLIAGMIRKDHPALNISTTDHSLANINGVQIDYAHHGPSTGYYRWTSGNVARNYLRSLVDTELVHRREPPSLMLRAHHHKLCWETYRTRDAAGMPHEYHLVVLPSYCGLSEHAQQVTRSEYLISTGLIAFPIVDGELGRIQPFVRSLDVRNKEEL